MPWIVNSEVSQQSAVSIQDSEGNAADRSESFRVIEVLLRAVVTKV
jgi:hypothetical protein